MRVVWYAGIAFAGLGWLLVWLEREVPLRSKVNSKFGLEEKQKKEADVEKGASEQAVAESTTTIID